MKQGVKIKKIIIFDPMKPHRRSYTYALLAILCWSTVGSAFKITLRYVDFLHLLLFSSFVAVVVLGMIILIRKKVRFLKVLTFPDLARSALMGFLNPFLYYIVLLRAYELLPAQEAGTLNYFWPLVLVILSIPILHQRISLLSIVAIMISFTGIIMISTHGHLLSFHFSDPLGVALALGSAFFWAIYWLINMRDKREEVTKLFLNFSFGFIYILVTFLITGEVTIPGWKGIFGSAYIGIFEMGITFVFWLLALKYSSTTAKVSNLIYISPFVSLLFIHFIVGEVVLISTVLGLFFIVSGIILQQYLK
jgi:drug/metabolite transporter (DMT)-like permease